MIFRLKKISATTKIFVIQTIFKKKITRIFFKIFAFAPDCDFFRDFFRPTHPGGWQNVAPPRAGGCGISTLSVVGQNPPLRAMRKIRPYRFSIFGSWPVVNLMTVGLPGPNCPLPSIERSRQLSAPVNRTLPSIERSRQSNAPVNRTLPSIERSRQSNAPVNRKPKPKPGKVPVVRAW